METGVDVNPSACLTKRSKGQSQHVQVQMLSDVGLSTSVPRCLNYFEAILEARTILILEGAPVALMLKLHGLLQRGTEGSPQTYWMD